MKADQLMTDAPHVSVLLVTYNHAAYVRQALDSVLMQQTSASVEIVVADDHSIDATLASIAGHDAGPYVRVLPSEARVGVTRNYQRGFAACRGRYVAVLEGDDFWIARDKLARAIDVLDSAPASPACFHRFLHYEECGGRVTVQPSLHSVAEVGALTARRLAARNWIGNFSACVYRRSALERIDPGLFELPAVADWMFNIVVAQEGAIAFIPQVMSVYRAHAAGIWSGRDRRQGLAAMERLVDHYDEYLGFRFRAEFRAFMRDFTAEQEAA